MQNQENETKKKGKGAPFSIHKLVFMGIMVALSIVFGKLLAFPHGGVIRFSLENLPILFTGIALGPIYGGFVGLTADLIGCLLVGYEINPIITIASVLIGVLSGLCYKGLHTKNTLPRLTLAVCVSHIVGSIIIKTYGLSEFYMATQNMGFFTLMGWRFLNYLVVGAVELFLLYMLLRSKSVSAQIKKLNSPKS